MLLVKDGIRYEMLSERNLLGAARCVSATFTRSEPMSHHLGLTFDDFLTFAHAYYRGLIGAGMSLVALDERTNEVIGVRMSEDYCKQGDLSIEGLTPNFMPLFAILEALGQYFRQNHRLISGKYAHMFMVAVDKGYTKRGIAPNMYRLFLRLVMDMGFTHAVTEPTGVISQHVLANKFGFQELHRINYADFEYKGKKPFADLKGHGCAILMMKELSELKEILQEP